VDNDDQPPRRVHVESAARITIVYFGVEVEAVIDWRYNDRNRVLERWFEQQEERQEGQWEEVGGS
jgi:hypothetical protein